MANRLNRARAYAEITPARLPKSPKGSVIHGGGMITVRSGTFSKEQAAFSTYKFALIDKTNNGKPLPSPVWVPTLDLGRSSQKRIYYQCLKCGKTTFRQLVLITTKPKCLSCKRATSIDLRNKKIKELMGKYPGLVFPAGTALLDQKTRIPIRLKCGCMVTTSIHKISTRGLPGCIHREMPLWRQLERIIRDSIKETKPPAGFPIRKLKPDCITDESIIEIKSSFNDLFRNRPSPNRDLATVFLQYQSTAKRFGLNFFVLVNESHQNVPKRWGQQVLGWEQWHRVGIPKKAIQRARKLRENPMLVRVKKHSPEELEALADFRLLSKRLGTLPSPSATRRLIGISIERIRRIALGKTGGSKKELAKAIGLRNPKYWVQLRGHNRILTTYYFEGEHLRMAEITARLNVGSHFLARLFARASSDTVRLPHRIQRQGRLVKFKHGGKLVRRIKPAKSSKAN